MADDTNEVQPISADGGAVTPADTAVVDALGPAVLDAGVKAAEAAAVVTEQQKAQEVAQQVVVDALTGVGSEGRQSAATAALDAAPKEEKQDLAKAVVDRLDDAAKKELVASMLPLASNDRKSVYIAGFAVAAVLALGFGLIAAFTAGDDNSGVATAAIAAATSLPSAIIGGLMGALTSKD